MADFADIIDQLEAEGPNDDACYQEAGHRPEFCSLKYWHHEHGCQQQYNDVYQIG